MPWLQGPLQTSVMCPCWLCVVLIIWLVDTVCRVVQLAYRLQFISLHAIILVPQLPISLLRLAPSTAYYIYAWLVHCTWKIHWINPVVVKPNVILLSQIHGISRNIFAQECQIDAIISEDIVRQKRISL